MKKYTIDELIIKMNYVHNYKYEYDFKNYENVKSKITICCDIHGYFIQMVSDHLYGHGCKKCAIEKNLLKKRNKLDDLITRSMDIHKNKYEYFLIKNYKNMHEPIKIVCKKHGKFETTFHSHLNKERGCKYCDIDNRKDNKEIFREKSDNVHNNKYDYSLVEYKNSKTKVKIICPEHGIFKQSPNYHIQGQGCPKCKSSKGELKVIEYLKNKEIDYEYQKKFENLKYKRNLIFDFYLPDHNICIEYDGMQHFKKVKNWGGDSGLKELKIKDKLKDEYCLKNKIVLIRIKYDENVFDKLNKLLK